MSIAYNRRRKLIRDFRSFGVRVLPLLESDTLKLVAKPFADELKQLLQDSKAR